MAHDPKPGPTSAVVKPARGVNGVVRIPGDKSISHRYAMLAGIAEGTSRFHNFSAARDCASTLDCMAKLGCEWKRVENGAIEVTGHRAAIESSEEALDCGNSGSTMRMLSGILAGQSFASELYRRRVALATSDGAHHEAALRNGRNHIRHGRRKVLH